MGITRRSAKKGNPARARHKVRVAKDEQGNRIPPLPRGFKKSQCYYDASLGRWVLKSHGAAKYARVSNLSEEELLRSIFEALPDDPAA